MIDYPFAILCGFIGVIINIIFRLIRKNPIKRVIISSVLILYLSSVAAVTLFPIVFDAPEYSSGVEWYNIIPFKTIFQTFQNGITSTALFQVFGNIILTVPFGILVLFLIKNVNIKKLIILALSLPSAIEIIQLFIGLIFNYRYRNPDIDDVILNMCGIFIGYGLYFLTKKIYTKLIKST